METPQATMKPLDERRFKKKHTQGQKLANDKYYMKRLFHLLKEYRSWNMSTKGQKKER